MWQGEQIFFDFNDLFQMIWAPRAQGLATRVSSFRYSSPSQSRWDWMHWIQTPDPLRTNCDPASPVSYTSQQGWHAGPRLTLRVKQFLTWLPRVQLPLHALRALDVRNLTCKPCWLIRARACNLPGQSHPLLVSISALKLMFPRSEPIYV